MKIFVRRKNNRTIETIPKCIRFEKEKISEVDGVGASFRTTFFHLFFALWHRNGLFARKRRSQHRFPGERRCTCQRIRVYTVLGLALTPLRLHSTFEMHRLYQFTPAQRFAFSTSCSRFTAIVRTLQLSRFPPSLSFFFKYKLRETLPQVPILF